MSILLKNDLTPWEWSRTIKASTATNKTYPQWVSDNFTAAEMAAGYMDAGTFHRPLYQLKHKAGLLDQLLNTNSNHNLIAAAGTPAQPLEFVLIGYEQFNKLPLFDTNEDMEHTASNYASHLGQVLSRKEKGA